MTKCTFCGKEQSYFKGINLIKNDGSIDYFCSSKCRRNYLNLKRDKRKVKWTEAFRIHLEKVKIRAEEKAKREAEAEKLRQEREKQKAEKKARIKANKEAKKKKKAVKRVTKKKV